MHKQKPEKETKISTIREGIQNIQNCITHVVLVGSIVFESYLLLQ
uniref:Uncharacterized protein n=1 Tax=Arundo donax TaxID=35708 RepID=A0A0A9A1Z9_ARUDO